MISVDYKDLYFILKHTPENQNILIVGKHGIGKSQIVQNFYKTKNLKVVELFLGQMSDPGDILGFPQINLKTERMEFIPPYWFPKDNEKIVLFLDELNRARSEILQAVMDLTLNRKLAGRKLPEGCIVISAINDGEEYDLTSLDPALISRFNVYRFEPRIQEWIEWARKHTIDERVVHFIEKNPEMLDGNYFNREEFSDLAVFPDRRAWHRISDIIKSFTTITLNHYKLFAGLIGEIAASSFLADLRVTLAVHGIDILQKGNLIFNKITNLNLPEKTKCIDSLFFELNKILDDDKHLKNYCTNFDSFIIWAYTEEIEMLAYFVSVFMQAEYVYANEFIPKHCKKAYALLIQFIEKI